MGYSFDLHHGRRRRRFAIKRASDVTLVNRGDALAGAPGKVVHMRMQAEGASTTRLRGRAWLDETAEPAPWRLEAEDADPAFQVAGSLGFTAYVSASSTTGEVDTLFDDFVAHALP